MEFISVATYCFYKFLSRKLFFKCPKKFSSTVTAPVTLACYKRPRSIEIIRWICLPADQNDRWPCELSNRMWKRKYSSTPDGPAVSTHPGLTSKIKSKVRKSVNRTISGVNFASYRRAVIEQQDPRLRKIWAQTRIPVVYRQERPKPILARLPYSSDNYTWLRDNYRFKPRWHPTDKSWEYLSPGSMIWLHAC